MATVDDFRKRRSEMLNQKVGGLSSSPRALVRTALLASSKTFKTPQVRGLAPNPEHLHQLQIPSRDTHIFVHAGIADCLAAASNPFQTLNQFWLNLFET